MYQMFLHWITQKLTTRFGLFLTPKAKQHFTDLLKLYLADVQRRGYGLHRQDVLQDEKIAHEFAVHKLQTGEIVTLPSTYLHKCPFRCSR